MPRRKDNCHQQGCPTSNHREEAPSDLHHVHEECGAQRHEPTLHSSRRSRASNGAHLGSAPIASAVDGGHVMIVGDEHQLAPTVKDQRAEWDGLICSHLARRNRNRKGFKHFVMLEVQYRMHLDIQRFPNVQYYDGVFKCGF